jgi:hypothetical protein
MRSRVVLLTLGLFLAMSLGCAKKADESATTAPNTDQTAAQNAAPASTAPAAAPAMAPAAETKKPEPPKPIVVPVGTVLTVRLGQAVGSKISQSGQTFTATLAAPVEVDGKTVIPSGAEASGTVVTAQAAGKFKGASLLQLRLDSITVQGRQHSVQTSSVEQSQKGKGKRTAVLAGGGAGLGALIGGLAGGGKGAVIGALAGGGAGTAGAAYTGKADVTIPAESALSFKLEAPLEIRR